jgi:8-oxo-dGTP diphosphatase
MKYHKYTCACALRSGKNVWMSERLLADNFAGYWQFAGGKCEENENPIDAAVREVKEETNLDIAVFRMKYLDQIKGDPSTHTCFVYYVDLNEAEVPVRTENLNSDWVLLDYDEVLKKHLMPGIPQCIAKLKKEP